MKPTKCPAREKKMRQKSKKRGEERKRKVKVKTAAVHAQTSQADVLHLDQKATNCKTCNRLCGRF